jgi:DNA invertase Pin-like site-specific DNA recombinase
LDPKRSHLAPPQAGGESANTIASTLGVSRATVYRVLAEDADE